MLELLAVLVLISLHDALNSLQPGLLVFAAGTERPVANSASLLADIQSPALLPFPGAIRR